MRASSPNETGTTRLARSRSLPLQAHVLADHINNVELTLELLGEVHANESEWAMYIQISSGSTRTGGGERWHNGGMLWA